jgi:hypothetical protein
MLKTLDINILNCNKYNYFLLAFKILNCYIKIYIIAVFLTILLE